MIAPLLSYQVSVTDRRAIGALEALRTLIVVCTLFWPGIAFVTGCVNSTAASPRIGGVIFFPWSTECSGSLLVVPAWAASAAPAETIELITAAATAKRARFITILPELTS